MPLCPGGNSRNRKIYKLIYYRKVAKRKEKLVKMEELDLLEEMEHEEADEEILDEIEQRKSARKKTFSSVINKKRINKFELDEVMV